jgi:hypothetical protein
MASDKLLLLHGIDPTCGCTIGKPKGDNSMAYRKPYKKVAKRSVRRRVKRGSFRGVGNIGYSKTELKASFNAVKGVMMTGLIAAGGAVITRKIFDAFEKTETAKTMKMTKGSMTESLAMAAVGITGGILIVKFLKKADIGTAFAIGPIVVAGMNLLGEVLGETSGLGYIDVEKTGFRPGQMALGATRVAPTNFIPQVVPMDQAYGTY